MQFLFYLIILVVGLIIYYLVNPDPMEDSRKLAKKFANMGNMTGMHMNNMMQRVGQPFSRSAIGNDTLLQWMQTGYHISILFDENGFFKKITHESFIG